MVRCNHSDIMHIDRSVFYCSEDSVTEDGLKIELDSKKESDIPFCNIYDVSKDNLAHEEYHDTYHAVVTDAPAMIRYDVVSKLSEVLIPCYQKISSINILRMGEDEEKIAFIYSGKKYSNILESKLSLEDVENIISTVDSLHKLGIVHGGINHETIKYDGEEEEYILLDCSMAPCGSYQIPAYEHGERAKAHRFGKCELDFLADYYALGILFICCTIDGGFDSFKEAEAQMRNMSAEKRSQYFLDLFRTGDYRRSQIINVISVLLNGDLEECRQIVQTIRGGQAIRYISKLSSDAILKDGGEKLYYSMNEIASSVARGAFVAAGGESISARDFVSQVLAFDSKWAKFIYENFKESIVKMHPLLRRPDYSESTIATILSFDMMKQSGDDSLYLIWNKGELSYSMRSIRFMLAYAEITNDLDLISHFHKILSYEYQKLFANYAPDLCFFENTSEKLFASLPSSHLQGYGGLDKSLHSDKRKLFHFFLYHAATNMPYSSAITNGRLCFSVSDVVKYMAEKITDFHAGAQSEEQGGCALDSIPITYSLYDFIMARLNLFSWPKLALATQVSSLADDRWLVLVSLLNKVESNLDEQKVIVGDVYHKVKKVLAECFFGKKNRKEAIAGLKSARARGAFKDILEFLQEKKLNLDKLQYQTVLSKQSDIRNKMNIYSNMLRDESLLRKVCLSFYTILLSFFFVLYVMYIVFSI